MNTEEDPFASVNVAPAPLANDSNFDFTNPETNNIATETNLNSN